MGLTSSRNAPRASPANAARPASGTAAFPNRQIAIAMTAITAGLIPAKTDAACGKVPNRT